MTILPYTFRCLDAKAIVLCCAVVANRRACQLMLRRTTSGHYSSLPTLPPLQRASRTNTTTSHIHEKSSRRSYGLLASTTSSTASDPASHVPLHKTAESGRSITRQLILSKCESAKALGLYISTSFLCKPSPVYRHLLRKESKTHAYASHLQSWHQRKPPLSFPQPTVP